MEFNDKQWTIIAEEMGRQFNLTDEGLKKLKVNHVAKLIASIPYFAKCQEPQKTALNHLHTYMYAKSPDGKEAFLHKIKDDVSLIARLKPISNFKGGIKSIIERGMNLLALIQLEDHKADLEIDKKNKKYNPILSGAWNYNKSREMLVANIGNVPCQKMDKIVNFQGEIMGWWDND